MLLLNLDVAYTFIINYRILYLISFLAYFYFFYYIYSIFLEAKKFYKDFSNGFIDKITLDLNITVLKLHGLAFLNQKFFVKLLITSFVLIKIKVIIKTN